MKEELKDNMVELSDKVSSDCHNARVVYARGEGGSVIFFCQKCNQPSNPNGFYRTQEGKRYIYPPPKNKSAPNRQ